MGHRDGHTDNAIGLAVAERKSPKTGDTHAHTHFQSKGNKLALRTSIILNFYNHIFALCFKQCANFGGSRSGKCQETGTSGLMEVTQSCAILSICLCCGSSELAF